jgi:hypothetical protein
MIIKLKVNDSVASALNQIDENHYVERVKIYVSSQMNLKQEEIDQYRIIRVGLNLPNGVVDLGTRFE